ncbi:MAG: hypothetical protein WCT33_04380 [Patescibacteria group bacterium]
MEDVALYTPYRWRPDPAKLFRDIVSPLLMVLATLGLTKIGKGEIVYTILVSCGFMLLCMFYTGYFWRKMWLACIAVSLLICASRYGVTTLIPIVAFIATLIWERIPPIIRQHYPRNDVQCKFVPVPYDRRLPPACPRCNALGTIIFGQLYRLELYPGQRADNQSKILNRPALEKSELFRCTKCLHNFEIDPCVDDD